LRKICLKLSQVYLAAIKLNIKVIGIFSSSTKLFLSPAICNVQVLGDVGLVIKVFKEIIEYSWTIVTYLTNCPARHSVQAFAQPPDPMEDLTISH